MPFPKFEDPDVEIRFTEKDEPYLLHSYVLALHSPWFKASLFERWSQGDTRPPGAKRVYEVRFEKQAGEGALIRRISVGETEMLDFIPDNTALTALDERKSVSDNPQMLERLRSIMAHDTMFGALYHVLPHFVETWSKSSRRLIQTFARTVDYYGCAELTRAYVRDFPTKYRQEILSECWSMEYTMVKFGYLVQCDWIMQESATYIIARHTKSKEPTFFVDDDSLTNLRYLLRRKRSRLAQLLKDAELDLLRLKGSRTQAGRIARDYFRRCVVDYDPLGEMKPGYSAFVRRLWRDRDRLTLNGLLLNSGNIHVHEHDPGNSELDAKIDEELANLGARAAGIVEPLLRDVTLKQEGPTSYTDLRSKIIENHELPWKQ